MWNITQEERNTISKFLDQQGLTFKPLREEIFDHLLGDIETHIDAGHSFETAWSSISNDISRNHFKQIQNETMEAISKRFNVSRVFSILALVLLATSSSFKLLHLPGAAILLITSMVSIAISMLISGLSGVVLYKEKQGKILLFLTILGILYFFFGWVTLILNFSEAGLYRMSSVLILLVLFPMLTIYFRLKLSSENNILLYLHKKHIPGVERFLLILLGIAFILRIFSIIFQYPPNVAEILLVLTAMASGLQFFAINWHALGNENKSKNWHTVTVIVLFILFIIPTLGSQIDLHWRVAFTTSFYVLAGITAVKHDQTKTWHYAMIGLIGFVFICWSLGRLEIINQEFHQYIFNIPILLMLILGLYFSRKNAMLSTYMVIVIAHYLYEYPELIGPY